MMTQITEGQASPDLNGLTKTYNNWCSRQSSDYIPKIKYQKLESK